MEFIPFILAIILFVPMLYIGLVALWALHAVATILINGPRKGAQIIRSW